MRLINKPRRTGKSVLLINASFATGFRIITPNSGMANNLAILAKHMGLDIKTPLSDIEYRNREKFCSEHEPIFIDELTPQILQEALELYFNAPVVAATMTVPIDDSCLKIFEIKKEENACDKEDKL